jgi:hypothetical protein
MIIRISNSNSNIIERKRYIEDTIRNDPLRQGNYALLSEYQQMANLRSNYIVNDPNNPDLIYLPTFEEVNKLYKLYYDSLNKKNQEELNRKLEEQNLIIQQQEQEKKQKFEKQAKEDLDQATGGLSSFIEQYKYYIIAGLIVLFILRR